MKLKDSDEYRRWLDDVEEQAEYAYYLHEIEKGVAVALSQPQTTKDENETGK